MRRIATLAGCVLLAGAASGSTAPERPAADARGWLTVIDLQALPLEPADTLWQSILPLQSRRSSVGGPATSLEIVRWPAGGGIPAQARELYWTGVLLKGALIIAAEGSEGFAHSTNGPAFFLIPAGIVHSVRCSPRSECLVLTFQGGPHNAPTFTATTVDTLGLPPYVHDLMSATWIEVEPQVWRGEFVNSSWARMSVGADDASLWRVASGARVNDCVGSKAHTRVGVIVKGALDFTLGTRAVPAGEGSLYRGPAGFACTCVAPGGCLVLAN